MGRLELDLRMAQNRDRWQAFVNAAKNLKFSWDEENFLTSWGPASFSGKTLHHGVASWVYLILNNGKNKQKTVVRWGEGNQFPNTDGKLSEVK
jgi:hypothetical protein